MADGSLDTSGVPRPPGLRPNQKTGNPCDNLHDQGHCHWGDRCYYAHSPEETELFRQWVRAVKKQQAREGAAPPPERTFRTQICRLWREGRCANGAACTFAHGEEHLRVPRQPGSAGEQAAEEDAAETLVPQPIAIPAAPRRTRPQGLCRWWHERGHCTKGDTCVFLHGETPADYVSSRPAVQAPPGLAVPPAGPRRERQQEQQQGAAGGSSENGWHYDQPPSCHPSVYKTVLCSYFMEKGRCRFGDNCNFAHGEQELRPYRREDDYGHERAPASQPRQPLGPSFNQQPQPGPASPPGPTPAQPAAALGVQVRAYLPPGLRETYAASLQLPTSAVRSHADRVDLASEADFPPLAGSGPNGGSAGHAARRPASAPSPRKSAFAGGSGGSMHSSGGPSTPTQAGKAADGPSSPCLGSDSEGSLGHAASSSASMEAEAEPPAAPEAEAAPAVEAEAAPAVEAAATLAAPVSCSEAVSWADACEEAEREEREGAAGRGPPAGAAAAIVEPSPAAPSVPSGGSSAGAEQCEGLQLQPQEEEAAEAEPTLQAAEAFSAQQSIVAAGPQGDGDSSPAWAPAAHEEPEAQPAHSQAPACPMPEAPPSPAVEFSLAHTGSPAASPAPMPGSAAAQPHLPPASPLHHAQPQMGHTTLPLEAAYMPPSLVPPATPAPAVPAGAGEQGAPPGWQAAGPAPAGPPAQPAAVAFGIHCLATFRCPLTKLVFRDPVSAQDGYTYERAAIEDWISKYGWVSPMTGRPLRELPVHSTTVRQMLDEVADVLQCFAATAAPPPPPPAAAGGAGTPAPPPPLRPPPGFPAAALQHQPPLVPYGAPAAPPASGGAMPPPPLPPHMWR